MLSEKPSNGYPDSLFKPGFISGTQFFGFYRKLEPGEYILNRIAGLITLRIELPENFTAGIVYKTKNNKQYGVGSRDLPMNDDTMLLKMFKVGNLSPEVSPIAWELKMKNIYRLPVSEVINDSFFLDIYYKENDNYLRTYPGSGIPLLQMLQLDKYVGNTRLPPPDGIFDFLNGYTIIPLTGDIIFPSLYPFRDKIPDVNYKFEEIYTQGKNAAASSPKAQYYHIRGFAKSS